MKRILNQTIIDPFSERAAQTNIGTQEKPVFRDVTTAHAIRAFLVNGFNADPRAGLTGASIDDSHHALRVLDALRPFRLMDEAFNAPGPKAIKLEDADFDWLIKAAKERGSRVWNILTEVFIKAIEALDTIEESPAPETPANGDGSKPRLVKAGSK